MVGWSITESRADLEGVDLSVMPPCNVYQTPAHQGIAVTAAAYDRRIAQIANLLATDVRPDVITFQEVSGTEAVKEALGAAADDFHVCSFDGKYKVQRLAFAWRKSLGNAAEACADVAAISLPSLPDVQQVRPGYTVGLRLNGKLVRFLSVHLKSSCVSSLEKGKLDGNTGPKDPCPILQQQVAPIEQAFETLATGADHFIVLGDFNRNLWHEANRVAGSDPSRSDGSALTLPLPAGVKTRNLLLEVNDGTPAASKAKLLSATCPGSAELQAACDASKTAKPDPTQMKLLTGKTGLGCRNPVGLDHMLVSDSLAAAVKSTTKITIKSNGASLSPNPPKFPEPLLAVSDHCPLVAEVAF